MRSQIQDDVSKNEKSQTNTSITWRKSLRFRLMRVLVLMSLFIAILMTSLFFVITQNRTNIRHIESAEVAAQLTASLLDGETVDRYLSTLMKDEEYERLLNSMRTIQRQSYVSFIYITRIVDGGEIFIFDTDEEEPIGLGEFESWHQEGYHIDLVPRLIAGERVKPYISNTRWGWLLTVHEPIYRADGSVAGYANVDIYMNSVLDDQRGLFILVGFIAMMIFAISVTSYWFIIQKNVISPIKILVKNVSDYKPGETKPHKNVSLRLGDELELLDHVLVEMETRVEDAILAQKRMETELEAALKAEQEAASLLNDANERFRLMLNATPLICNLWNKDYQVFDCNEEALKLFEMDKKDYMDKFVELAPEFQPDGQCTVDKARNLLDIAFSEGKCVFEWMNQKLDGTLIPMEVTLTRVAYGDDYVAAGYGRDLRDHKKMTDEISYQNSLLETVHRVSSALLEPDINEFKSSLFTAMGMMAKAVDADRVYIWKNHVKDGRLYCTQVHEWSEGVEPHQGNKYTVDVSYDEDFSFLKDVLLRGDCINSLVRDMPPAEQSYLSPLEIMSILVVPIFLNEQFWGFVGFDDCHKERIFTENEELILRSASRMIANALIRNHMTQNILDTSARLDEANRIKSDFLAKISHEIRTPMNAIIGMTELALREEMTDNAREHAITIKQAGINLLSIINDILDYSKIESGNMEITPVCYSLSSLINDVVSIIRMKAADCPIRFVVNLDSNLPDALIGDETKIRQIFINLLGNAVKYTHSGYVSFTVHGEISEINTINLTMKVKDTGRGIKKEDIGKLFDSYFQLSTESDKDIEGVGLGLTITWNIVKAMDGEITVQSEYGKGSTFTVTLPQEIHNPEKLAAVENPDEKVAIIYERREIYADSIFYTINNLGVHCEIVSNDEKFCDMLKIDSFSYIFVSYALFEKNSDTILKFGSNSQIVLLAEFGESIPAGNWSVLSMPTHAISVANIFNGVSDRFSYNTSDELTVRFTAPNAKVLVVDDINTNLKVARGLLLPYKMDVDLCTSGAEAIEAVQSKDYDIVFMDHRMPEMDGVEATERIRALGDEEPYYKNIPIIALTANAVAGMKEMFLQNGFDDFLSKPIDTVILNTILEKWIPKEKQTGSTTKSSKAVKTNKPFMTIEIEGFDADRGVLLSGGTIEYYYETLAVFYEDGLERKDEIRKCLDTGNLPLYTTHVHALKSASAYVGAEELSEAAYALETAGQRGDLSFIKTNNNYFLMMLERLLSNINNALSSRGASGNKEYTSFDTEHFKTVLANLKSALKEMDGDVINRSVDILLRLACAGNVKAVVRKISNHILMAEYDEADILIHSLLHQLSL